MWVAIWLVLSTIFIAVFWTPQKIVYLVPCEDDMEQILYVTDAAELNDCIVDENGHVMVNGSDPYVVYNVELTDAKTVALKFCNPMMDSFAGQLYINYGVGFYEADSTTVRYVSGEEYIVFQTRGEMYAQIRVDINYDYDMECIEIHSNAPEEVVSQYVTPRWWIAVGVGIATLLVAVAVFLDIRFRYMNVFFEKCDAKIRKWNAKTIGIHFAVYVGIIIIGIIVPTIIRGGFNPYYSFFCIGIMLAIAFIVLGWNQLKEEPEKVFVKVLVLVCLVMMMSTPFSHVTWDVDSHYGNTLAASYWTADTQFTLADYHIVHNEGEHVYISNGWTESVEKVRTFNNEYAQGIISSSESNISLPYLLGGIFIAVARLFGLKFYFIFQSGIVANIIIYALLCYFAMKQLKSGKMILAVIALIPTNLYLASSYSYDYWVNGFSFLGVAYYVGLMQDRDREIGWKDALIMMGTLALACLPKQIYAGLMLIPFLVPPKRIRNKKLYYGICIVIFAALVASLFKRTGTETGSTGDVRGGSAINPAEQITYILSDIKGYMQVLLNFLRYYISPRWAYNYMVNFAELGLSTGSAYIGALIAVTTLTDKNEMDVRRYPVMTRAYTILLYVGEAALIATAFYLVFTPVGATYIAGCQYRYLMPMIYPILAMLAGRGIYLKKINRSVYCSIIIAGSLAVAHYTIYNMLLIHWIA